MGTDKALIELDGTALVMRAVNALEAAAAEPVLIVGGDSTAFVALGLTPIADLWPGEGPLGGIITALEAQSTDVVMVLSCDLTDASAIAVRSVVGALGEADVVVPVVEGHGQWLHTAWRRRCQPVLRDAFERGVRAPRHAARSLDVVELLDGDPCWYHDADRPDDLPGSSVTPDRRRHG
jgi:molybdenum cofactor guanylyltransferase